MRKPRHERRLHQVLLDELVVDLVREHELGGDAVQLEVGVRLLAFHLGLFELRREVELEPVVAHQFLHERLVLDAAVGRIEVDDGLRLAVLDLALADHRVAEVREESLHDRLHRRAVAVGLIDLAHRELGVVRAVDALVAEVLAELEHLVHAADEQPLQVQLRRDAHHAVLVERVEVREERLCRRTTGLVLQDWCLDFGEALGPQVLADLSKQLRPREEARARLVVRHEIDVAAAVARLFVGEAVELLRRLLERLREHRPFLDDQRLLSLLRREKSSFRADDVAEVQLLERRERSFGKLVAFEDELEPSRPVVHGAEVHLAHAADHQQASRDTHGLVLLKRGSYLHEVLVVVLAAIRLVAHFLQRLHRLKTLLTILIRFLCHSVHIIS